MFSPLRGRGRSTESAPRPTTKGSSGVPHRQTGKGSISQTNGEIVVTLALDVALQKGKVAFSPLYMKAPHIPSALPETITTHFGALLKQILKGTG